MNSFKSLQQPLWQTRGTDARTFIIDSFHGCTWCDILLCSHNSMTTTMKSLMKTEWWVISILIQAQTFWNFFFKRLERKSCDCQSGLAYYSPLLIENSSLSWTNLTSFWIILCSCNLRDDKHHDLKRYRSFYPKMTLDHSWDTIP